jgi:branched-chain amino acid transport system permease protein
MFEVSGATLVSGLINGFCLSCIYILIALGLTLILSIMNIMQFAHGEIYMIGAFVTYYLAVRLGINVFLAMFISMVVVGILGIILERFIFRRFMDRFLQIICITLGLMLIFQTSVSLIFGPGQKFLPNIWPGAFHFLSGTVSNDRLAAVIVSIGLTLLLFLFLKRSKYGQAIIATAQHREGALLQGINPYLMYAIVMGTGSALAAIAGSFAGAIFILNPYMGTSALMKGIMIVVLGGSGSLIGVIIGGLLLGMCDSVIPMVFGSAPSVIAPLILIIIILVIRPQGIFGHE